MLRKSYLSIQPKRMKKVGIFLLFANTFLFTLVFSMVAMTDYAQGYYGLTNSYYLPTTANNNATTSYYNGFTNLYSQPTTTNYNATNSYYKNSTTNPYLYGTNYYSQPSNSATSYSQPSNNYSNTSGYLTNYGASTQGSYYNGNSTPSNTNSNGYTTLSSFYNKPTTNYGTLSGNYYTTSTPTYGTATQEFYNPTTNYTGSTGSFYTAPSTFNSGFYNTPASTANSYYNNTYYRTAASSPPYYPNASTYVPAATGYTINQTTDVSGLYKGRWARNYSSTGAQTAGRISNSESMGMRSLYDIVRSSNSTSATSGTCGGEGNGNGGNGNGGNSLLPINLNLTQAAASVAGEVIFLDEAENAKTISVNGTIENGNVINLSGTTPGIIGDPALYAIKITATLKTNVLDGAYTLTNTVTNTNIELGTFTADRTP